MSLARVARDRTWLGDRGRHWPRLAEPQWQLDFMVDGVSMADRVTAVYPDIWGNVPVVSVVDSVAPAYGATALQVLAGSAGRAEEWVGLGEGRVALYGCGVCGDLGCGAITVKVRRLESLSGSPAVRWDDIRFEDATTPADEMPDLSTVGPFTFDAAAYAEVLASAAERLEGLAGEERATEAEWRRHHTIAGRVRRLLSR